MWPFKRKTAKFNGSFMTEEGVLDCQCGEKIPIALSCVLETVPFYRFKGMAPPQILMKGIPCPSCERSHSARMDTQAS